MPENENAPAAGDGRGADKALRRERPNHSTEESFSRPLVIGESIFIAGRSVGRIIQDLTAGVVTFEPRGESNRLSTRRWHHVDDARRAVVAFYTAKDRGR